MEDDALMHCTRGSPACTTTASDEARARMETKTAVETAYIIKQTFIRRVLFRGRGVSREARVVVVRIDGCLLKEFTHVASVRMNDWQRLLYSHFGTPHGDVIARLMVTTMKLK